MSIQAQPSISQKDFPRVSGMALVRAIRAFEPAAFAEPFQGLFGDDVTARHHHRWILVGALFFGYGTDEDGVEEV